VDLVFVTLNITPLARLVRKLIHSTVTLEQEPEKKDFKKGSHGKGNWSDEKKPIFEVPEGEKTGEEAKEQARRERRAKNRQHEKLNIKGLLQWILKKNETHTFETGLTAADLHAKAKTDD
jgi:hypothetical protein